MKGNINKKNYFFKIFVFKKNYIILQSNLEL